jgi:hypothetical protein
VKCAACGRSYLKRDAVAEFEADLDGLDYESDGRATSAARARSSG